MSPCALGKTIPFILYFHTGSFLISDIKNIPIDVVINR